MSTQAYISSEYSRYNKTEIWLSAIEKKINANYEFEMLKKSRSLNLGRWNI